MRSTATDGDQALPPYALARHCLIIIVKLLQPLISIRMPYHWAALLEASGICSMGRPTSTPAHRPIRNVGRRPTVLKRGILCTGPDRCMRDRNVYLRASVSYVSSNRICRRKWNQPQAKVDVVVPRRCHASCPGCGSLLPCSSCTGVRRSATRRVSTSSIRLVRRQEPSPLRCRPVRQRYSRATFPGRLLPKPLTRSPSAIRRRTVNRPRALFPSGWMSASSCPRSVPGGLSMSIGLRLPSAISRHEPLQAVHDIRHR